MKKPKIITKCVANNYASPNERIVEFSNGTIGGLISFRILDDGKMSVHVYQQDPAVTVTIGKAEG